MTLKDVMALTLRHFNQFAKPAFQLMTGSSSIRDPTRSVDSFRVT